MTTGLRSRAVADPRAAFVIGFAAGATAALLLGLTLWLGLSL